MINEPEMENFEEKKTSDESGMIELNEEDKPMCNDSLDEYENDIYEDNEKPFKMLVETTIGYLAKINCKMICSNLGFSLASKKYFNIKIRTCYFKKNNEISSCIAKISKEQGEELAELVGWRFDDANDGTGWFYFEAE